MNIRHQQLASGKWTTMPFCLQMANIGSEISRTINWQKKGNQEYARKALYRALELIDLTVITATKSACRELLRTREALVDYFLFDNNYHSSADIWQKYFDQFALLAARQTGR